MHDFFSTVLAWAQSGGLTSLLRNGLDFLVILVLIYCVLYFLRGTRSANVVFGVTLILGCTTLLAYILQLRVLGYLLDAFWTIFGFALVVIFQPELRRALAQAGSIFSHSNIEKKTIDEVVNAVMAMSETHTGALIVFEKNIGLAGIVNASIKLDSKVSAPLIQTIFFKNSPLHDCAMIIRNNKIVAAHAVLPLSQEEQYNTVRRLGTRHRAAIGITEETDAVALIVSEENGIVSVAYKGRLIRGFTTEELIAQLNFLLISKGDFHEVFARTRPEPIPDTSGHADLFNPEDFNAGGPDA